MMYCPHCGKQLPEGAKFCTSCGAALTGPAPAQPEPPRERAYAPAEPENYAQPRHTPPARKSHKGLIIVLSALLIGVFVIAPAMERHNSATAGSGGTASGTAGGSSAGTVSGESDDSGWAGRPANDEYYQALAVIGYQEPNSFAKMSNGLDAPTLEYFVRDNGDGSIECYDYAAVDDQVVRYCETILLDLSMVPPEQKDQVTANLTAGLPALNALDFVTAEYIEDTAGMRARLNVECMDLDREENRQALVDMGIFDENGAWSLSEIKKELTSMGYISLFK